MTVTTTAGVITTVTNTGIINSFGNTPQAKDDLFTTAALASFTEDSRSVTLDVMANDGGGNGKSLWSLDDGTSAGGIRPTDLLAQDAIGAVQYSARGAEIRITADGKVSYTMTAASTANFQSLAAGEIGTDTFTYAIRMGNGTISWATATVQIMGTNDAPVITSAAQSGAVKEDTTLTATGTVTSSDVDNGATAAYSGNATGTYGSFAVTAGGVWTYTLANAAQQSLAQGETKSETFTITVSDGLGGTATQDVVMTITGTNDKPVITSAAQAGAVKEDTTLTATGTVTSSDVDNGATAAYSGNATGTYGSFAVTAGGVWTYTLANAAQQSLAQGETKSETFTVTVTDDKGATATQDVAITIMGTNDAASISGTSTGSVTEDTTLSASGTLTVTDVDTGQAVFQTQTNTAGTYGSFNIGANGNWTYALNNSAANVQALNTADRVSDSFTVLSQDGTASQVVAVSVNGLNEPQLNLVADFESLPSGGMIPDGYSGFNWDVHVPGMNLYALNGDTYGGGGYRVAALDDGSMVAYTPYGYEPVTITRSNGGDFKFNSVELTAAWVNLSVTLTGYNNGTMVGTMPASLSTTSESTVTANWGYIDQLVIDVIGTSGNRHLVLDDFTYSL